MPFALLDDRFHANPKIKAAGLDGAGLYALALSYCGDHVTDGFVPHTWAKSIVGRSNRLISRLENVGLWISSRPGDVLEMTDKRGNSFTRTVTEPGYFIPDFVQHNVSSVEAEQRRKEKAKAGRKGAIKRWSDSSSHSSSQRHQPSQADSSSQGKTMADANGKTMARAHARAWDPSPTPLGGSKTDHQTSSKAEAGLSRADFENPAAAINDFAPNTADPIVRLVLELRDRDNGTDHVLRSNFGQLPEAAFAYALEEVRRCRATSESDSGLAYAILERISETGVIGDEIIPPSDPARSPKPAVDPVARRRRFVETSGWQLEPDHLEDELGEMGATDDELVGLLELAADLRRGAVV